MKSKISALLVCLSLVFCLSVLGIVYLYKSPGPLPEDKVLIIEQGKGFRQIAASLEQEGIIPSQYLFLLYGYSLDYQKKLQSGEFLFNKHITYQDVFDILLTGDSITHALTIPEGLTITEIKSLIDNEAILKGSIDEFIIAEGSLFPDTYYYTYGDSKEDIIKRMRKTMDKILFDEWSNRDPSLPYQSKYEALIMASIVEKESAKPEELPRVSGVYLNRLKQNIKLQADPTVIYAITLGKTSLDRALLYKDLEFPSPFNTYYTTGLPPTPICNPGKKAIHATLHPESHEYIYFVADGTGGHVFAKTISEHELNVQKWRKINSNNNVNQQKIIQGE